jgi:hypothetical protein
MKTKWTKKWPTKPGRYWFYGWPYGHQWEIGGKFVEPELNCVNVWKVSNGITLVREGNGWDESEGGIGLFCVVDLPELPDVAHLIKEPKK